MRKIFIPLLILVVLFSLGAQKKLTIEEILKAGKWETGDSYHTFKLSFIDGSMVEVEVLGMSMDSTKGRYAINGNEIMIELESPIAFFDKTIDLTLTEPKDSPIYRYYLEYTEAISFQSEALKVSARTELKLDGVEYISVFTQKIRTTVNLNIRALPSIKSRIIYEGDFSGDFIGDLPGRDSFRVKEKKAPPKGTLYTVYGRSKSKMKVGDWEDYWYLIKLDRNHGYGDGEPLLDFGWKKEAYGWVFGHFIEFK